MLLKAKRKYSCKPVQEFICNLRSFFSTAHNAQLFYVQHPGTVIKPFFLKRWKDARYL
jgi:hypothetical protein